MDSPTRPDAALPQKKAELMAGRIPLDDATCRDAGKLAQASWSDRLTAEEIGWLHE